LTMANNVLLLKWGTLIIMFIDFSLIFFLYQ